MKKNKIKTKKTKSNIDVEFNKNKFPNEIINSNINSIYNNKNNKQKNFDIKNSLVIDEAIVNSIINKIISSVILITNKERIYKNFNTYCFNYIKKLISTFLLSEIISYENVSNTNELKNNIFYNYTKTSKKDTWTYISEPEASNIDRCANKIILIKKNNINFKNINNNKNNLIEEEIYENKKTIHKMDIYANKEEINVNNNSKDIDKEYDYKIILLKKRNLSKDDKELNFDEKYDKIIEMPSIDILKDKKEIDIMKRNEEIKNLRKEYNIIINKKRASNIFSIKSKQQLKPVKRMYIHNFDSNKYTFDPNGKVIHLHLPKLQVSSEFNTPKQKIINKIIKNEQDLIGSNIKKNYKKISFKKSLISSFSKFNLNDNIKAKGTHYSIRAKFRNSLVNTNFLTLKDQKYKELYSSIKEKINITNNFNIRNTKENIEYNPNDRKSYWYFNKFKKLNKQRIIGGENFEKIIPEVGVIIHDDYKKYQKKEGGFNYLSKYFKCSINEYSKLLDNSKNFLSENNSYSSLLLEKDNYDYNNYNGYKEEFSDNNNPLFKNAHFINNNKERILSSFSKDRNFSDNNLKNKNYTLDIRDSNKNKINLKSSLSSINIMNKYGNSMNNIKLSGNKKINYIYNLLNDEKKDKINYNSDNNISKNKNIVSIKELLDRKRKLPLIEKLKKKNKEIMNGRNILNKFNLNIIKNKEWGRGNSFEHSVDYNNEYKKKKYI